MKIVLDANIVFNHRFLDGPNFDLLEKYLKLSSSSIVLPRIVLEEIQNTYKETVNEAYTTCKDKIKKLNGLIIQKKRKRSKYLL